MWTETGEDTPLSAALGDYDSETGTLTIDFLSRIFYFCTSCRALGDILLAVCRVMMNLLHVY